MKKSTKKMTGSKTAKKASTGKTQKNNICSTCRKPKPKNCKNKTCNDCRKRAAGLRKKNRENAIKCAAIIKNGDIPCTNKVSKKCGNLYCEIHMTQWQEFTETNGKQVRRCSSRTQCDPGKPGMKAILPDNYKYKHCEKCRMHARTKDNELRDIKKKLSDKIQNENPELCKCLNCPISKIYNVEDMGLRNDGTISNLCKAHFEYQQQVDKQRERVHDKEKSKEYESRPARKAKKKLWREENPDLVYYAYTKSRGKKLREDPIGYRKKEAEQQAKWREAHPEALKKHLERYNTVVKVKYTTYKRYSEEKGYDFAIDADKFEEIITMDCYYCGLYRGIYLNGIDRLDNNIGYLEENIVPACKICNNMKNTLNESTFILMCMHISQINNFYPSKLYPHVFNDYRGSSYRQYMDRASSKNLEFMLSEKQFNGIRSKPCYICRKKTTDTHCNGIDRVDNNKGYIIDNCESCCGGCNYLKRDSNHDEFIYQCGFIAAQHKNRFSGLEEKWIPSEFRAVNTNKLSKLEIDSIKMERKLTREAKTLASKSPEACVAKMKEIRKRHKLNK